MHSPNLGAVVATIVAAGAFLACSPTSVPVSPTPSPPAVTAAPTTSVSDACVLVPDIEQISGRRLLVPALSSNAGGDFNCRWSFSDHPSEGAELTVGRPEAYADNLNTYTTLGGPGQVVEGLGVEAHLWSNVDDETVLAVKTSRHSLLVVVTMAAIGDRIPAAMSIGGSAVSHLRD